MKMMRQMILMTVAMMMGTAHAQMLRIQPKAVVEPHQDVHLGDIATITGADAQTAETLANTVILSSLSSEKTIKAESVLMAVIAQQAGGDIANKLQVSGSAQCQITIGTKVAQAFDAVNDKPSTSAMGRVTLGQPQVAVAAAPVATPVAAPAPVVKEASVITASVVDKTDTGDTLAKQIMSRLSHDLATPPEDLSITFDSINPALEEVITDSNKVWKFRPLSRALLGSVQFDVQLIENSRVLKKFTVSVKVEKRAMVLVATTTIGRGELVTPDCYTVEEMYLDRRMPTLFTKDSNVLGLEAQREIVAGAMLDQRDFKSAQLAAQNDPITVIFVSGQLKVQLACRAMEAGKLHDSIKVKNETTNEVLDATLIGKRIAVTGATLDEATEKRLLENK